MGWMFESKPEDVKVADHLAAKLNFESGGVKMECLDVAVVNMLTAYAAVRRTDDEGSYVFGVVFLLKYSNDYYNFGYKDMDECMGPCESECPERILNLLTPLEESPGSERGKEWARAWRERCRENIRRRAAQPKIVTGKYLVLANPMDFTDKRTRHTFYIQNARKRIFREVTPGGNLGIRIRLPQKKNLGTFVVVDAEEVGV